ncbi:endolytic transglycosylase MltG [Endozoicomonas sp. 8E]|uniref:endolytic transglycosylase MltG n=1 Tax=Endozoicomonas sp. 8E TaxID=3035692 RepID=UPI002938FBF8|nr:endolytic transglycosylase MltG [Endozoicomonas sp. 8E]WOG25760.1 endolytic transglycosylase MltG [Endozoicomonas sp. 8E]
MLKKLLFIVVGLCLAGLLTAIVFWEALGWYGDQPVMGPDGNDNLEFIISQGESMTAVADSLAELGWLQHPKIFVLLARIEKAAAGIHAGDYLIPAGISHRELLKIFTSGQVRYYNVTLVEGHTLKEVVAALNQHEKLSSPMDDKALQSLFKSLAIELNPEGLFFPDTYFFQSGATVESILRRAYNRMDSVLAEEWGRRAEGLPYKNPYEALIMASLVEKETGVAYERGEIAGVFVRRLQKGMRLQTDPTVIYGLGDSYKGNISRQMLRRATPYNTYVIKGLPPTPIAIAGREAIHAALHPKDGKTLYFVAKGDGTHYFSKTLAEHNRAVRKYQIEQRREDYRSTVETQ